jgi:hypothetical protein
MAPQGRDPVLISKHLGVIAAAAVFCSTSVLAQSLDGAYRGMFVCEQMPGGPDVLHVPLDVVIRNGAVQSARPLFNWNGTRVLGSELASGTSTPTANCSSRPIGSCAASPMTAATAVR